LLDKLRAMVVDSLSKHLYNSKHRIIWTYTFIKKIHKCKQFLKNINNIFVTKADKSQVTVIMDKSTYINQMTKTLDGGNTYRQIKNDPL